MRIFVSAGEVSGDQALSAILAALRPRLPALALAGLGGDGAREQGLRPLAPLGRTAVSGIGDVFLSALDLTRMRRAALGALAAEGAERPDLALLVDYPGLNLELARLARSRGIPVYYLAPPQAWVYRDPAAKAARAARSLAGAVVHVLFPFEKETFAASASKVVCGHFLGEALAAGEARSARSARGPGRKRLLALCPGSRRHALRRNLPAWLSALGKAGVVPGTGAAGAGAAGGASSGGGPGDGRDGVPKDGPEGLLVLVPPHLAEEARALLARSVPGTGGGAPIEVVTDKGRILRDAEWALAFPGTITLELALAGIPAAVAAALDPVTLAWGRRVVKGPWLGLPNLLLGREAFPEWAGRASALSPGVASALWERLRGLSPGEVRAAAAGLRDLMGPASGAEVAAAECLKILEKS